MLNIYEKSLFNNYFKIKTNFNLKEIVLTDCIHAHAATRVLSDVHVEIGAIISHHFPIKTIGNHGTLWQIF